MSDASDDTPTRPGTPRAKLSTHNRMQIRELVRTWIEMSPRKRHARVEYENGVEWAIVKDDRGNTSRLPLGPDDDVWVIWGRCLGNLPERT